ncbi:MAG: DUF4433 domain-containing protein [Planctomycetota bacterium]|nr:DUF4433 domain-containing protein [Planctomycetota bacterium]
MAVPVPTPILRFIHVDNLPTYLQRGGMHAPNFTPNDGLPWKVIHDEEVQAKRARRRVRCGPGGVLHDYVSFYFGYLSPMMLRLHTGRVEGYTENQEPLIYLVSAAQTVQQSATPFIFTNGHGIAAITDDFDDLSDLARVDWGMVYQKYWADKPLGDNDRQRRKQAEFLVHRFCPWPLVRKIAVIDEARKRQVEVVLARFPNSHQPVVTVRRDWYY